MFNGIVENECGFMPLLAILVSQQYGGGDTGNGLRTSQQWRDKLYEQVKPTIPNDIIITHLMLLFRAWAITIFKKEWYNICKFVKFVSVLNTLCKLL